MTTALLIVDVQNDFIEGGTLAVTGGEQVARKLADHVNLVEYATIITTQDWHINPGTHWSETPNYVDTWPIHCAAGTNGAEFHPTLQKALTETTTPQLHILKGEYKADYSGFQGRNAAGGIANTATLLRDRAITDLSIVGLATDHCIKATVLDALNAGFTVTLLTDFIAGVDPERSTTAIAEMKAAGAIIL